MKMAMIAGLLAVQLLASAEPAPAADFVETRQVQAGAFAGFRLRVPLGADPERRGFQAGLAIAPMVRDTAPDGRARTRLGEGLELGFAHRRPLTLRLAGTPVDRLGIAPGGRSPDGSRAHVSTVGWIAIAVGGTVAVVAVAGVIAFNEIRNNEYDD